MTCFCVIDLETTSREASEAEIVEWAAIWLTTAGWEVGEPCGGLVKPSLPIPPETSAIHHIIDEDVVDAPTWDVAVKGLLPLVSLDEIAVAHNAQYERTILKPWLSPDTRWLCTYKASLRVWPEAPSHSNESLRYWLKLPGIGRKAGQAPHSAKHDALVTAEILARLLDHASVEDMLKWTEEPALLPTCPIGDWRGKPWSEIDDGFLHWIMKKAGSMREDVVFCARKEIDRREEEQRRERLADRAEAAAAAAADDDIPF